MYTKISNLLLFAAIWTMLTGIPNDASSSVLLLIIPVLVLAFSLACSLPPFGSSFKLRAFYYIFWLLREIILSTITVIKISWQKNLKIHPVMRPIKSIQTSDIGKVIYANSITLTPGTVTLSIHDNILMVHALDISLMDDLEKGTMDMMVKEIIK